MSVDDEQQEAKRVAASFAVERWVRPGQKLALGTGSTAAEAVRALARRFPEAPFDCVASSDATDALARSLGLSVRPLRGDDRFDLMLDGADEVTPALALTKGGGGALFREKLLAHLSDEVVILVDPSKLVDGLGERHAIPVEVVPFARPIVEREVTALGYTLVPPDRPAAKRRRSDNGNDLLDLKPASPVRDPFGAHRALRSILGVVETGIFVDLADRVLVGHADGHVDERRSASARSR